MPQSYKTQMAVKRRKRARKSKIFKPVKNRKQPTNCAEPCSGGKWLFSKTPKGTRRTCSECGFSVTECGDREPSVIMVKYQGVLQPEAKRRINQKVKRDETPI